MRGRETDGKTGRLVKLRWRDLVGERGERGRKRRKGPSIPFPTRAETSKSLNDTPGLDSQPGDRGWVLALWSLWSPYPPPRARLLG